MSLTSVGRRFSLLTLAGVSLLGGASSAEPAPPRYVVTHLPPGVPAQINDAGEITGSMYVTTGTITSPHAAVFRNGAWHDLGVLEDDTASGGYGINNFGVVVGFSSKVVDGFNDTRYRAIQSASDGPVQAVLPLVGMDAFANAINDLGQVCGQMGPLLPDNQKPWRAFIADGTSLTDLHPFVEGALGGTRSRTIALDINEYGDVVGRAEENFTPWSGFLYENGTVTILEGSDGSGGTWSLYTPTAINDSGLVAGVALVSPLGSPAQQLAVVYDATTQTLTTLPAPAGGLPLLTSSARDIDAAGRVVGDALLSVSPTSSRWLAFLYEDGEMLDLNTLIPPDSDWDLQSAMAINDTGQIIGRGKFQNEFGHYFLLTPANEPPTVTLESPLSVGEGSPLTVTATAMDAEGGTLVYDWDLDGDGSYEVTDGGDAVMLDPAGDDGPATRTVGVRVTDEGGLTATASTTLDILNEAPTATLSASATTVYVNGVVDLTLTNPLDPSAADTSAGFSYAWDCAGTGFEAGIGTHGCAYTVGGTKTIRARIEDKDGGFTEYEVAVDVTTAEQGIAGLIQTVTGFGLPTGIENSFLTKLEHALAALQAGNLGAACGDLQAFVNHAQAQSGKKLTAEQATLIIGEAEAIRAALGCT